MFYTRKLLICPQIWRLILSCMLCQSFNLKLRVSHKLHSGVFLVVSFLTANQHFAHLSHAHVYAKLPNFIQLSITLTKLCHITNDRPVNFYISLDPNPSRHFLNVAQWCRMCLQVYRPLKTSVVTIQDGGRLKTIPRHHKV